MGPREEESHLLDAYTACGVGTLLLLPLSTLEATLAPGVTTTVRDGEAGEGKCLAQAHSTSGAGEETTCSWASVYHVVVPEGHLGPHLGPTPHGYSH